MYTLEIIVHRPDTGTRTQDQLARIYSDQAGKLRESIEKLNHPMVRIEVPEVEPKFWYPVILSLLPENTVKFCVFENVGVPGAKEHTPIPWTWLVREDVPWLAEPAALSEDHSLRKAELAQYGSHPPTLDGPVFHGEDERLLYVSGDWCRYSTRDFAGKTDPRFPDVCFDATSTEGAP